MKIPEHVEISPGRPLPLGANLRNGGVQFSVLSRHARGITLNLYDNPEDGKPAYSLELDPIHNRTGDIWHVYIKGIGAGQLYLYKADGPYRPEEGHRFNGNKPLLDPYAKALTGNFKWQLDLARGYDPRDPRKDLSFSRFDNTAAFPKCIVIDDSFDWQGDKPLNYPLRYSVIYETHAAGLTRHHTSGVKHPGTYRGVIEKIPYLLDLGITSLELLPLQEFDAYENIHKNPVTGETLENYWGYSTIAFFAPKGTYAGECARGEQVTEFKEMVRELHKAGIEVILDIVFNHTGENDELGPTLSFRGLDNSIYYILAKNPRRYKNYSGCGNTMNCNHPLVRSLILDCLRYWVVEMHVDGFRFDLGSILGRDSEGKLMENPPVLERIAEDPVLRDTKIIAEAWDAAGAYQVGSFPGGRWAEWNDKFRDDVRRFWRGDPDLTSNLATRLTGSSDLYLGNGRKPFHSINFVTSHDGFTLHDLVSYRRKHNLENGEENADGSDVNFSCNYGKEGAATDPEIQEIRKRQIKNFLATLFLSLGTPMLLGGDEFMRSQGGNNNAYCQNNQISWHDWSLPDKHKDIFRFCRKLIEFRHDHPVFHRPEFYTGQDRDANSIPDISWYDAAGKPADWSGSGSVLALWIDGGKEEIHADRDDNHFYMMFNGSRQSTVFTLYPDLPQREWYRVIDTGNESPSDIVSPRSEPPISPPVSYTVLPQSMAVLIS
ncbi:MAG: glycogen debranching protein GlgX [Spirochaetia bacterium]